MDGHFQYAFLTIGHGALTSAGEFEGELENRFEAVHHGQARGPPVECFLKCLFVPYPEYGFYE